MENKTARYLKYALGEIILVMVGILLALQVNDWNDDRKDIKKEQQILIRLSEDYAANLLELEQKITHRNKMIKAATQVLEYIDEPSSVSHDNLILKLNILIGTPVYKPIQNNLINSTNILLIKNDKLNRLLTTWPSDVSNVKGVENIWNRKVWESIVPLYTDLGILREGLYRWWDDEQNLKWILDGKANNPFFIPKSNGSLTTNEILKNKQLEGIISLAISVNYAANLQSKVLRKRILEILELLDKEIKEKPRKTNK